MRISRNVGRIGGVAVGLAGVGLVLAGCGGSPLASPAPSSTPPAPTTSAPSAKHHHADGIAGQITAENGSSWTIQTKSGKQYTATINASTQFGTKATPATQQQFTVGEQVRVAGSINGTSVTATRIAEPAAPSSSAGPTPTTTPSSVPA